MLNAETAQRTVGSVEEFSAACVVRSLAVPCLPIPRNFLHNVEIIGGRNTVQCLYTKACTEPCATSVALVTTEI